MKLNLPTLALVLLQTAVLAAPKPPVKLAPKDFKVAPFTSTAKSEKMEAKDETPQSIQSKIMVTTRRLVSTFEVKTSNREFRVDIFKYDDSGLMEGTFYRSRPLEENGKAVGWIWVRDSGAGESTLFLKSTTVKEAELEAVDALAKK